MARFIALLLVLIALWPATPAHADKRVALVVGNSAYQNTSELRNPSNDASDIAAALTRLGFQVTDGRDLDKRAMERTIRQFGLALEGADIALFFYAGHGIQVGGQNHLIPVDARLASEGDVDFETLPLSLVLKQMEREAKTSLVLLDACRDNPLARNLARSMGTRAITIGTGLAEVKTGIGTLIGFSTQPGNVAADGVGRNSPYAGALLKHIEDSAKDVSGILVDVRNDVLKVTNGAQVPWEHTSLTGQVYFRLEPAAPPEPAPASPSGRNYDKEMEIAFWDAVKDSKNPAVLKTYLDRFPRGTFASLARIFMEEAAKPGRSGAAPGDAASSSGAASPSAGTSAPTAVSKDPRALARALQAELKRVGCDPGPIDGNWGKKAEDALAEFARQSKTTLARDASQEALKAVAAQPARVCRLVCGADEMERDGKCVAKATPARRRPQVVETAPKRKKEGTSGPSGTSGTSGKMCWSNDRRNMAVVPCGDAASSGQRAY